MLRKNLGQVVALLLTSAALVSCSAEAEEEEETAQSVSFSGAANTSAVSYSSDSLGVSKPGDPCFFPDDFGVPKLSKGMQVTLRDSSGSVIGLSELGEGGFLRGWSEDGMPYVSGSTDFILDVCVFPFEFIEVDSKDEFFSIEVGGNEEVQVTRQDLVDSKVSLLF